LPLAECLPLVLERLRHVSHLLWIKGIINRRVSVTRLRMSVAALTGRRWGGRGLLRYLLVHIRHNLARSLFRELVQRGDVLHASLEMVFDVEGKVFQLEYPLTMKPCSILNCITTRTRGCRRRSVSGAVKFLFPGSHQVVTHSCATHAVRVKHICFFPVFKTAKQLL
jgi:hypothetical protein